MPTPDILIIGNGYLGNRLKEHFAERAQMLPGRIESQSNVLAAIERFNPDILINAAAFTGRPNIEACDKDPGRTIRNNVTLPYWIANACAQTGRRMVHLSTGCLYQGYKQEFTEEDAPNFNGGIYTASKREAELILTAVRPTPLILRVRLPLDSQPHPRNMLTKLIAFLNTGKPILDAPNSITYVPDFLDITEKLINGHHSGIFNMVTKGGLRYPQLLERYFEYNNSRRDYTTCTLEDFEEKVSNGKANCLLSVSKLESLGIKVPTADFAMTRAVMGFSTKPRENTFS